MLLQPSSIFLCTQWVLCLCWWLNGIKDWSEVLWLFSVGCHRNSQKAYCRTQPLLIISPGSLEYMRYGKDNLVEITLGSLSLTRNHYAFWGRVSFILVCFVPLTRLDISLGEVLILFLFYYHIFSHRMEE